MDTGQVPAQDEFIPGDRVMVTNGTFLGMLGRIASPEEASALQQAIGGEASMLKAHKGLVWVVLPVFGKDVPVQLEPFQLQAVE